MTVHDTDPSAQGRWEKTNTIVWQREQQKVAPLSRTQKVRAGGPHPTPGTYQPGPWKAQVDPGERLCATTSLAEHGLNPPAWRLVEQLYTHGLWCVPRDSGMCRVTPGCAM